MLRANEPAPKWVAGKAGNLTTSLVYNKMRFRAAPENATKSLASEVKLAMGERMQIMLEESPAGDTQSTGRAERTVRAIKGQIRTLKGGTRVAHRSDDSSWRASV